jgi:hypothetical protein
VSVWLLPVSTSSFPSRALKSIAELSLSRLILLKKLSLSEPNSPQFSLGVSHQAAAAAAALSAALTFKQLSFLLLLLLQELGCSEQSCHNIEPPPTCEEASKGRVTGYCVLCMKEQGWHCVTGYYTRTPSSCRTYLIKRTNPSPSAEEKFNSKHFMVYLSPGNPATMGGTEMKVARIPWDPTICNAKLRFPAATSCTRRLQTTLSQCNGGGDKWWKRWKEGRKEERKKERISENMYLRQRPGLTADNKL